MRLHNLLLTTGAICAVSLAAAYAAAPTAETFVRKAGISGHFEVESSKLALEKSQDAKVKEFAQRMIDDHTAASEKLKAAAQASDAKTVPPETLDDKHQKLMQTLKSASGDNFDQQYVSIQTDAHKEAVDLFGSYAAEGKDKALKNFAEQTLPTLKDHLVHVSSLKP